MQYEELQRQHAEWLRARFPDQQPEIPAAGLVEEAGELLHAVLALKRREKWGPDPRYPLGRLQAQLADGVGDIAVYVCSYCNSEGVTCDFAALMAGVHSAAVADVLKAAMVLVQHCCSFAQETEPREARALSDILSLAKAIALRYGMSFESCVLDTWRRVRDRVARPTVVCLCGSTRFKQLWYQAGKDETYAGRVVLSVGNLQPNAEGTNVPLDPARKEMLDELHKRKIDMADEVLVLDGPLVFCDEHGWRQEFALDPRCTKCGRVCCWKPYVGSSTASEIAYAEAHGKPVRYWSKEHA